ncbi:MAG: hypothetical protein ACI8QT_000005 [Halioglobus sp.]|jgi:hypothetical protein
MKYSIFGMLFSVLLSAQGASANGYYTGAEMLKICTDVSPFQAKSCGGYIAGVADTSAKAVAWETLTAVRCVPVEVTIKQLMKIAVKYMEEHPEELHLGAESLIQNAFKEAFPCEK